MRALLAPLQELGEYDEIRKILGREHTAIAVNGCVDSEKLHMVYGLSDGFKYKIIVTFSDLKAKELYEDYKFYDRNVTIYPGKDLIFFQADIHGNQLIMQRMKCLRRLMENKPATIITTFDALMAPQIPLSIQEENIIHINKQNTLNESTLATRPVELGY